MKMIKHNWPTWRRAGLVTDKVARQAFRLFKTFPALDYGTLVDLGAHRGEFAESARRVLEPRRLVLVEADPELARDLERRYAHEPAIEVVHAAVTDHTGPVQLRINAHRDSTSILPITAQAERQFELDMRELRQVEVPGLTLDELFEAHELERVALLKVDIQGAERQMIAGGAQALARVESLYIEVCFEEFYAGSADFHGLDALLRELGFKVRSFHESQLGRDGCMAYTNALYTRPGR
jgi:FkbM family methyltransferase